MCHVAASWAHGPAMVRRMVGAGAGASGGSTEQAEENGLIERAR